MSLDSRGIDTAGGEDAGKSAMMYSVKVPANYVVRSMAGMES